MKNPIPVFDFETDNLSVTFNNISQNSSSYFWNFGDGNSSTETNPTHNYSIQGTYNVELIASNEACDSKTYLSSVTVTTTGIDNNIKDFITVYPNPTNGNINIIYSKLNKSSTITLILTDNLGKRHIIDNYINISSSEIQINVNGFSAGIYHLQIQLDNQQININNIIIID